MNMPLDGIVVLDISRVIAGPTCCMHLGDMGAEVIRIESPPDGDLTRKLLPFSQRYPEGRLFSPFNRNKKCIGLQIFSEEGRSIFMDLLNKADVFVENFRPGVLRKWNLDYNSVKELNPRLIYCSITGYSSTGPHRNRAGFDFAIQAESGLMSINGEPNVRPLKTAVPIGDLQAALYASSAIIASLFAREREGRGRLLEVSIFGVALSLLAERAWAYILAGEIPDRIGNRGLIKTVVSDYFETADGGVIFTLSTQRMWENLCEVEEFSHLAGDSRFSDPENRQKSVDLLT